MKRILPYILIAVIVLQLFAPFSVGINKGQISFDKKIASAEFNIDLSVTKTTTDSSITINTLVKDGSKTRDVSTWVTKSMNFYLEATLLNGSTVLDTQKKPIQVNYSAPNTIPIDFKFENLTEKTPYVVKINLVSQTIKYLGADMREVPGDPVIVTSSSIDAPTEATGGTATTGIESDISASGAGVTGDANSILPACTMIPMRLSGCIAQGIYYLFFKTSSFVFALAGKALDFTLMYSISDSSYRSGFVVEGWGVVRDFCNMFFIFVLLYIAFATMLNLNGVKTKEMIITVVVIGLLMNFSLFATQVIIDTSNILTRVFYNQKTIIVGEEKTDSAGNKLPTVSELGGFKEIKLSEAIVSKINPQELILKSSEVEGIAIKGTQKNESGQVIDGSTNNENRDVNNEKKGGISVGTFIIVTLLATAVNVVGIMAFLSVALIFIGRVVMLWMAMILSPLVFFSYTVPALGNLSMIGHKKWWPETLGMAFVAPVFAFFMYLIVQFLDTGLGVISSAAKTGGSGLNFVIGITVPFAFIMVLLMKAKSVAVSMSGEVGAALSKAGSAVGGLALGAATGGASMLGRATVGRLGSSIANSEYLKGKEAAGGIKGFGAKMLRNIGTGAGKASFDVRNTSAGKAATKGMGVDAGKAKEGGFIKSKADQIEKDKKRSKELELGEGSRAKRELHEKEDNLKTLRNTNGGEIDSAEKDIVTAQQELTDAKNALSGKPKDTLAQKEVSDRAQKLKEEKAKLKKLKEGGVVADKNADGSIKKDANGKSVDKKNTDGTYVYNTSNGNISKDGLKVAEKQEKDDDIAKSNAVQNTITVNTEAEKQRDLAFTAAAEAQKAAIEKASGDGVKAIASATEKVAVAIEKAQQLVTAAASAAAVADLAQHQNDTPENKINAKNTKDALTVANNNLGVITTSHQNTISDATKNAENAKQLAGEKAVKDEIAAQKEANAVKFEAMKKAADKESSAIKKASESNAEAILARKSSSRDGGVGKTIKELNTEVILATAGVDKTNNERKGAQAKNLESTGSKVINLVISGGQYSPSGADQAAHEIRANVKA